MKLYDKMLDACHHALKQFYEDQHVSFKELADMLNAGSSETLRKIAADNYKNFHPTLRTLEDLGNALGIEFPEYDIEEGLSTEAQTDLHSVAGFFEYFDEHQRNRVIHYCGEVDEDRRYYESRRSYRNPAQRAQPMAADQPARYGTSSSRTHHAVWKDPDQEKGGSNPGKNPGQQDTSSDRKTD